MYKCKYCDKEFFFEGKLKRHLIFNHPNEPEDSELYTSIRDEILGGSLHYNSVSSPPTWPNTRFIYDEVEPQRPLFTPSSRITQRHFNIEYTTIPRVDEDLSMDWTHSDIVIIPMPTDF